MISLKNKRIIITGGTSMVGRQVVKRLQKEECTIQPLFHEDVDLLNYKQTVELFEDMKPDYCIHLAGYNGNIKFNSLYPADIYFNTTMMGLNVLNACHKNGIKKVISLLSSCGYRPSDTPLEEKNYLNGEPDQSTEAHAYGKRDLLIYSKMLNKQYGYNAVSAICNTVYGPHDNFDLEKTKVMGSLVKKFCDATMNGEKKITCWGTGMARREFVFCEDVGNLIVEALKKYDDPQMPLNIGTGKDYTIKEIVEKISKISGYTGTVEWDTSKPDGQMRKVLDCSRMNQQQINTTFTDIDEGIKKTIEWYLEEKNTNV